MVLHFVTPIQCLPTQELGAKDNPIERPGEWCHKFSHNDQSPPTLSLSWGKSQYWGWSCSLEQKQMFCSKTERGQQDVISRYDSRLRSFSADFRNHERYKTGSHNLEIHMYIYLYVKSSYIYTDPCREPASMRKSTLWNRICRMMRKVCAGDDRHLQQWQDVHIITHLATKKVLLQL